ncbi:MAG: TaqI-like C-terminal specificity domain-containing protein [Desulfobacterales bacterium]
MQSHSRIFTDKYLDIKSAPLEKILSSGLEEKKALIRDWQEGIRSGRILQAKEEQLQSSFLHLFFGDVLGYAHSKGAAVWNLEEEQKTLADSTKMDGALGFFSLDSNGKTVADIKAVIELKDARTDLDKPQTRKNDRRTPVQQAFDYANAVGGTCRWVILSDFTEIRLYFHSDRTRYESFDILNLDREMRRFLFLLHRDRLITEKGESFTDTLHRERQEQEKNISRQFYADYRQARTSLFHHIREQNPNIGELALLNKTQKLLDRILFVCFCEDFGILPYFTFRSLLKSVKEDRFNRSDSKIWQRVKALFDAINSGYPEENINKFNGGLFADDEILDSLVIKDAVLEHVIALEVYDFASDLNVNILGHIFEQSVTDMEELKAEIAGKSFDRKKGKRKKEGIFYTPEYITRYIVEESVGGWLADRKTEIGFDRLPELTQADYDAVKKISKKRKANRNIDLHLQALEAYREKLRYIKVLDPACGSGAFLNQVFDFLYREGQKVNSEIAMLKGGQREVFDLDRDILTNNIFGVDLNAESVEITKLSLWLKTANKNKELTTLDSNIRCGNSLIDDPKVAGEKAFDWNAQFPEIMQNGGFDAVVGNPPYVRQELLSPYKPYFAEKYKCYSGMADLYVYFYEKGISLLKECGYFTYISNNFTRTFGAGNELRHYLKNCTRLISLADFSDVQIFDGATTYPIIITLKKENIADKFRYLRINAEDLNKLSHKMNINPKILEQSNLKDDFWNFESENINRIKEKIKAYPAVKDIFGKCYYGIKTGLNEAFILSGDQRNEIVKKSPKEAEIIKPFLEGKDIKKWHTPNVDKWIIFTRRGIDIDNYPIIKQKLLYFKEKLVPRNSSTRKIGRKPGKYEWYEIQDTVNYYKFFESPKIIWPNLQSGNKFSFDCDGFYINAPSVILPSDSRLLLCIVNSRLAWFFFKDICAIRSGGYIEMKPQYFEQLPVAVPDNETPFVQKADIMLTQNKALHRLKSDFLTFVQNELKPVSISKKLENWPDLDRDQFKIELKKAKVKMDDLNLKDRKQWQDYFLEQQKKALEIKSVIDKTDKEIDKMVYDLYGLTEEEIRIVEGSN